MVLSPCVGTVVIVAADQAMTWPVGASSGPTALHASGGHAGMIWPCASPKPTLLSSGPVADAVITTSSPSSSQARLLPSGRTSGSRPAHVSSMSDPYWSGCGPLTVPDANRSPVRTQAPLTVMCASICAGLQYMVAYGGRQTTCP